MRIPAVASVALVPILLSLGLPFAYAEYDVVIPLGASHEETGVFYSPSVVDIEPGQTVTWKNNDATVHTVSTGSPELGVDGRLDSGLISPGGSFSYTFGTAGVYGYYCVIHPWMTGTVDVGSGFGQQPPVSLSIQTDKQDYEAGDNITVTGHASRLLPDTMVTVWVTDLSGNGVASNHVSTVTTPEFSTTIMPTDLWIPGTEYVVNAQYGSTGEIATTKIWYGPSSTHLPRWLKETAYQWETGQMTDKTFAAGIQYMIKQGEIRTTHAYFVADQNYHIPQWVKNTASWWYGGEISGRDFASIIQYLLASGTIGVYP